MRKHNIPSWDPKTIFLTTIIAGVVLTVISLIYSLIAWAFNIQFPMFISVTSSLLAGGGVSILAAAFINRLRDKQSTDPIMPLVTKATLNAWSKVNHVRKNQKIKFQFLRDASRSTIIIKIIHEFEYENKTSIEEKFPFVYFNDCRCDKRFFFERVWIEGCQELKYEEKPVTKTQKETNALLTQSDDRNRLLFKEDNLALKPEKSTKFEFDIHSEYQMNDQFRWFF